MTEVLGRYINENLSANEKVLYLARFHWMYTVSACAGLVFSALFSMLIYWFPPGFIQDTLSVFPAGAAKFLALIVFAFGAYRYVAMMIYKHTTEIGVTNYRLVFKRGLISRRVESVNIDRVEGADMHQSMLGRMLGYGSLVVRGVGVGDVAMPPVEDPIGFRQAILEASTSLRR